MFEICILRMRFWEKILRKFEYIRNNNLIEVMTLIS